jgi:hypothetical protein
LQLFSRTEKLQNYFRKKSLKKYADNIFPEKTEMRALWSQVKKAGFFADPNGPFGKWTFINVQNRFVKIRFEKIHDFLFYRFEKNHYI